MRLSTVIVLTSFSSTAHLSIAAPNPTSIQQTSISHTLSLNATNKNTSLSAIPNPDYQDYPIPNTKLTLHLTLLQPLDRVAMGICLTTSKLWVGSQPRTEMIPRRGFEWKDAAGATVRIRSMSRRLTWGDVGDVLRGLNDGLYEEGKVRTFLSDFFLIFGSEDASWEYCSWCSFETEILQFRGHAWKRGMLTLKSTAVCYDKFHSGGDERARICWRREDGEICGAGGFGRYCGRMRVVVAFGMGRIKNQSLPNRRGPTEYITSKSLRKDFHPKRSRRSTWNVMHQPISMNLCP